jgi:hypothetical protein
MKNLKTARRKGKNFMFFMVILPHRLNDSQVCLNHDSKNIGVQINTSNSEEP